MIQQLLRHTLFVALLAMVGTALPVQAQGLLYWSDQGRTTLEAANVDGSSHQVLATGATPVLFALDAEADVVYHIDRDDGTIYRIQAGTRTATGRMVLVR